MFPVAGVSFFENENDSGEKEMHRVKDEEAIYRYLKLYQHKQKYDEVERVIDVSDYYDPEKVQALLKAQ